MSLHTRGRHRIITNRPILLPPAFRSIAVMSHTSSPARQAVDREVGRSNPRTAWVFVFMLILI